MVFKARGGVFGSEEVGKNDGAQDCEAGLAFIL